MAFPIRDGSPLKSFVSPVVEDKTTFVSTGKHRKTSHRCQMGNCDNRIPISMRSLVCKCDGVFCRMHRLPEDHDCTFDWKTYEREKFVQQQLNANKKRKLLFPGTNHNHTAF